MKVELLFQDKWNTQLKEFTDRWTFKTEAHRIFSADTCKIRVVTDFNYDGSITIHLTEIPERIDLTEDGDLWLGDAKFVKSFPQPYRSLGEKSRTIFTKPVVINHDK
jgi:hypothetical protein